MKRKDFDELYTKAYELLGVLGHMAETVEGPANKDLTAAYMKGSDMLDELEDLGIKLGYIDYMQNRSLD